MSKEGPERDSCIASGASLSLRDDSGKTALLHAEEKGHTRIVELLKAAGNNI